MLAWLASSLGMTLPSPSLLEIPFSAVVRLVRLAFPFFPLPFPAEGSRLAACSSALAVCALQAGKQAAMCRPLWVTGETGSVIVYL